MTQDINPGCNQRFTNLEGDLKDMKTDLGVQGGRLAELGTKVTEQAGKLEQHDDRLSELEEGHKGLSAKVSGVEASMAAMLTSIQGIQGELARLNTWQTRLIFLLVGALIVLALGTKAAELLKGIP